MARNPPGPWRIALCTSFFVICLAPSLRAAGAASGTSSASPDEIRALVRKEYPALEALYQHVHSHPELSLAEEQTGRRLAEELRAAGYQVTERVGGHGVVAVLENGKGKTLLIRTD